MTAFRALELLVPLALLAGLIALLTVALLTTAEVFVAGLWLPRTNP
jgi:hypothetical protein